MPYDALADEALRREWALQMVQAYAFGDRFQEAASKRYPLQLQIDHDLFQGLGHPTYFAVIFYAFNDLPESDPLLRLFVNIQVKHDNIAWTEGTEIRKSRKQRERTGYLGLLTTSRVVLHVVALN